MYLQVKFSRSDKQKNMHVRDYFSAYGQCVELQRVIVLRECWEKLLFSIVPRELGILRFSTSYFILCI